MLPGDEPDIPEWIESVSSLQTPGCMHLQILFVSGDKMVYILPRRNHSFVGFL